MKITRQYPLSLLLFYFLFSSAFAQEYLMDGSPIYDCDGFFLDSGGNIAEYGPNESFITTICGDNTVGTHISLIFSSVEIGPGDMLCFYDGQNQMAPLLACHDDFVAGASFIIQATAVNTSGCITVVFTSDATGEGIGWNADINCVASCQTVLSQLVSSTPLVDPIDTGYIDICVGDRVLLQGAGLYPQSGAIYNQSDLSSSFEWSYGDGTFSVGPNASHIYTESGGYVIELMITDTFGCKNTNFISQRVRVSPRPDFSIGTIPDDICVGDSIELNSMVNSFDSNQSVSVTPGTASFQSGGSRSDSLPLPDGTGAVYQTSIVLQDFSPGQIVTNVNDIESICVVIEHSYVRDLEIKLSCPDGTEIILHDFAGQVGGETFLGIPFEMDEGFIPPIQGQGWEYCWTPNATNGTWLQYMNAFLPQTLPQGDYNTFDNMSNLIGCPLNGEWTISVQDLWGIDNGWIFSWSINFREDLFPDLETFTPGLVDYGWENHPSIYDYSQDSISASPFNAGTTNYVFSVTDEFGCSYDTSIQLTVLPPTHPDCHTCEGDLEPLEDISVCAGDTVFIATNYDGILEKEITFETFPGTEFSWVTHPPSAPLRSTLNINSIYPATLTDPFIQIESICVDLTHSFDSDVDIFIESPSGQTLELSTDNGGAGDDYTNTCFSPTASMPITAGSPPFTGSFMPEGNWAALTGSTIEGAWTLVVADDIGVNDFGILNSWSITFVSENFLTYEWPSQSIGPCIGCPDIEVVGVSDTTVIVHAEDVFGCIIRDTADLIIDSAPLAPDVDCLLLGNGEMQFNWNVEAGVGSYQVNINNTTWEPSSGSDQHLVQNLNNGDTVFIQVQGIGACPGAIGTTSCIYFQCGNLTTNVTGEDPKCNGGSDGEAAVVPMGGNGPFTYMWSGGLSPNDSLNTGLAAGTYFVTVQDANMCTTIDTVVLMDPQPLSLMLDATPESCSGSNDGSASVSASGGTGTYQYVWSDPLQQQSAVATDLTAGTYVVTVTDSDQCQWVDSITIALASSLVIDSIIVTDISCFGNGDGSAEVFVSGATGLVTYQWNDPLSQNSSVVILLEAGNFEVTISDGGNCTLIDQIVINEPDSISVSPILADERCFDSNDGSITLLVSGGQGSYSYQWDDTNMSTDSILIDLDQGQYTVQITDQNNCIKTGVFTILGPSNALVAQASQTKIGCAGLDENRITGLASGGTGSLYDYFWDVGANSQSVSNVPPGQYILTVTDERNCQDMDTLIVVEYDTISMSVIRLEPTCYDTQDGSITVNVIQGGGGNGDLNQYDLQWQTQPPQLGPVIQNLEGGQTYTVDILDTAGCVQSLDFFLDSPDSMVITSSSIPVLCYGDSNGSASITDISGGNGAPFQYIWSSNAGNVNGASALNLTADAYTVIVEDAQGCQQSIIIDVAEPMELMLDVMVDNINCSGDASGSAEAVVTGGTPPYSYDWSNGGTTEIIENLPVGVYDINISDLNGCMTSGTADLFEADPLSATVDSQNVVCFGDRDGVLTINTIGGSPPYRFSLDGEFYNANNVFYNLAAGTYDVIIVDANDCTYTVRATILEPQPFIVDAGPDLEIDFGDSIQIMVTTSSTSPNITFEWSAPISGTLSCEDCQNPWSSTENTQLYHLVGRDSSGCIGEDFVLVRVIKRQDIYVPTGFTPNGDAVNNILNVFGKEGTVVNLFQVYDRWGEIVFESRDFFVNNTNIGWDGSFRNKKMNSGVYIWYIEATFEDGSTKKFHGQTTLIR